MATPNTSQCPQCGAAVPADAPQGLCPKCLLAGGKPTVAPKGKSTSPAEQAKAANQPTVIVPGGAKQTGERVNIADQPTLIVGPGGASAAKRAAKTKASKRGPILIVGTGPLVFALILLMIGWGAIRIVASRRIKPIETAEAAALKRIAETPLQDEEARALEESKQLEAKGLEAERAGQWAAALEQYKASIRAMERVEPKLHARAVQLVIDAMQLAQEQKWELAAEAYQLALADSAAKGQIQPRIAQCLQEAQRQKQLAREQRSKEAEQKMALAKQPTPQELEQMRKRMQCLLKMLDVTRRHRAALLACDYYAASERYAKLADEIAAAKARAQAAVKVDQQNNPQHWQDVKLQVLNQKDGKEWRGKVKKVGDQIYSVEIVGPGATKKVSVVAKKVASVEEVTVTAAQQKEEQARFIFGQALTALSAGKPLDAGERLGRVCTDFADTAFVKDVAQQRAVREKVVAEWTQRFNPTIAEMRSGLVPLMEARADKIAHTCPDCHGEGKRTCPLCQGTGKEMGKCKACRGIGKVLCPKCHGVGKVRCKKCDGRGYTTKRVVRFGKGDEVSVPCKYCKRTGWVNCRTCKGKKTLKCKKCGGTGQVPTIKCRRCQGSGKVKCERCGGTGRVD